MITEISEIFLSFFCLKPICSYFYGYVLFFCKLPRWLYNKALANVFILVSCIILLMKRASPLYLHFNCDNRYLSWWFRSIWEICMNIVCNGEGVDFILISMFSVSFVDPTKNWAKSSTNSWHIEGPSKHGVLCSKPDKHSVWFFWAIDKFLKRRKMF